MIAEKRPRYPTITLFPVEKRMCHVNVTGDHYRIAVQTREKPSEPRLPKKHKLPVSVHCSCAGYGFPGKPTNTQKHTDGRRYQRGMCPFREGLSSGDKAKLGEICPTGFPIGRPPPHLRPIARALLEAMAHPSWLIMCAAAAGYAAVASVPTARLGVDYSSPGSPSHRNAVPAT